MVAIPAENQISPTLGTLLKKCLKPTFLGGQRKLGLSKALSFPKTLLCRELLNQVFLDIIRNDIKYIMSLFVTLLIVMYILSNVKRTIIHPTRIPHLVLMMNLKYSSSFKRQKQKQAHLTKQMLLAKMRHPVCPIMA